jgi:hypothetical protein
LLPDQSRVLDLAAGVGWSWICLIFCSSSFNSSCKGFFFLHQIF